MPRIYRIYHVESRSDPTFTDKRDKMEIDSLFLLFLDILRICLEIVKTIILFCNDLF